LSDISGSESHGPFNSQSIGFNPQVEPIVYDPIAAQMDLMHRGWKKGVDGILEKYGTKFDLKILVDARSDIYKIIAKTIRQQLSEIGINVTVLLYDGEESLTSEYLEKNKPQAWLRFFEGGGVGETAGFEAVRDWYSGSEKPWTIWQYKNDEIDKLYKSLNSTHEEREIQRILREFHKIIYSEQPACFLFFPNSLFAINARFKNTDQTFSKSMPTYTMKDWYVLGNQ
jgi:peptide/nickel transport system substrate-binding protein